MRATARRSCKIYTAPAQVRTALSNRRTPPHPRFKRAVRNHKKIRTARSKPQTPPDRDSNGPLEATCCFERSVGTRGPAPSQIRTVRWDPPPRSSGGATTKQKDLYHASHSVPCRSSFGSKHFRSTIASASLVAEAASAASAMGFPRQRNRWDSTQQAELQFVAWLEHEQRMGWQAG